MKIMNRKFFLTLMLTTLALSACASNSLTPATGSNSSSPAATLPVQTQLILGTLKLEGTENAVTAEQAAELLPMWYVLKDISSSDAAAQEEIDGLVSQIQKTMTTAQTQAIAEMNLSPQDMMAIMQENGGGSSPRSTTSQSGQIPGGGADFGAGGPPDMAGGGFPAGGFPGGDMPAAPSDGTTSSSSDPTTTNRPAMMSGTPSALFDAVIELLKTKVK